MKRFILVSIISIAGLFLSLISKKDSLLEVANADTAYVGPCGTTVNCVFDGSVWVNDGGGSSGGCSSAGSASAS